MIVVGIISMKGGVGKTSTTANMACAMAAQLGADRVTVIDLDPQNGLHWHFGAGGEVTSGVCGHSLQNSDWADASLPSDFGVDCIPYGVVTESEREAFEALIGRQIDAWDRG